MPHSDCFSGPSLFDSSVMPLRVWWHNRINKPAVGPSLTRKGTATAEYQTCSTGKRRRRGFSDSASPLLRGCVHNAGTLRRQPENPLVSSLCLCRDTSGDPLGHVEWLRGQLEESATCCTFLCKDFGEFPSRDRCRRFARQLGPPPVSLRIRLPSNPPSCGFCIRELLFFSIVWADR